MPKRLARPRGIAWSYVPGCGYMGVAEHIRYGAADLGCYLKTDMFAGSVLDARLSVSHLATPISGCITQWLYASLRLLVGSAEPAGRD